MKSRRSSAPVKAILGAILNDFRFRQYPTLPTRAAMVGFMDYDLGYFDDETCRLEPLANPLGPSVLPMCPE